MGETPKEGRRLQLTNKALPGNPSAWDVSRLLGLVDHPESGPDRKGKGGGRRVSEGETVEEGFLLPRWDGSQGIVSRLPRSGGSSKGCREKVGVWKRSWALGRCDTKVSTLGGFLPGV